MKHFPIIAALILVLLVLFELRAAEPVSFKNIPFGCQCVAMGTDSLGFDGIVFGTQKQVVVAALAKKLGMTEKGYGSSPAYWSPEWMDMYDRDTALLVTNYKEGKARYDVSLFFNSNDKLCGFTMKARSRSAKRSGAGQRRDLMRLAEVVQNTSRAGAGCTVGGSAQHVVVAGMVPNNPRKAGPSRLVPVAGVWDKSLLEEPELGYSVELSPEKLQAAVEACFSTEDREEMARAAYVW